MENDIYKSNSCLICNREPDQIGRANFKRYYLYEEQKGKTCKKITVDFALEIPNDFDKNIKVIIKSSYSSIGIYERG